MPFSRLLWDHHHHHHHVRVSVTTHVFSCYVCGNPATTGAYSHLGRHHVADSRNFWRINTQSCGMAGYQKRFRIPLKEYTVCQCIYRGSGLGAKSLGSNCNAMTSATLLQSRCLGAAGTWCSMSEPSPGKTPEIPCNPVPLILKLGTSLMLSISMYYSLAEWESWRAFNIRGADYEAYCL